MRFGSSLAAIGAGVVLAAPAVASPSSPVVEALAPRAGLAAPVFGPGTVVWSEPDGQRAVRVRSRAVDGGIARDVSRVSLSGPGDEPVTWRLAAAADGLGLLAYSARATRGVLFVDRPEAGLTELRSGVPRGAAMAVDRDFWAWTGGFVTLERVGGAPGRLRAVVTDHQGVARPLALPAGSDPATLAVADATAAVVVAGERGAREVAVIDIATGVVRRRVDLGTLRGVVVISLDIASDGELALTGEGVGGGDLLGWAPVGAGLFERVMADDNFGQVQVAHGRIALVAPGGRRDAVRPLVVEPRIGQPSPIVFRGPPAYQIEALEFDGSHVAWASQHCQFVADAAAAASRLTVPAGPCARTEIAVTTFGSPTIAHRHPSLPVRIRCLTAPRGFCRLDVRAYEFGDSARIGRLRASVPRGAVRLLRVAIGQQAAERVRRARIDPTYFIVDAIDPDGRRSRTGPL